MAPTSPPTIALRLSILASLSLMAITCSSAFHIPSPSIPLKHHASFTKSTPPLSTQPSYHHHAAAISRSNNMLSICKKMSSRDNNNNSAPTPSQEEIAQQKSAAYNALASFHETSISLTQSSQIQSLLKDLGSDTLSKEEEEEAANKAEYWTCEKGAVTYNIPMDPAAGLKRGVSSKPYKCSVQVEMDLGEMGSRGSRTGKRGLRLVESIQFANGSNENDEHENDLSIPFVRSISLGANVDVDAVDGSYSLDDAIQSPSGEAASSSDGGGDESSPSLLPLLPPSLLLGAMDPTSIRFVVEHTLATSETERCRCFLLYGDAASGNGDGSSSSQVEDEEESAGDDEDDDDFAIAAAKKAKEISTSDGSETNYRLLGVILAEETKVMPKQDQTTEANESVDNEDEDDQITEFVSQMIETAPQSDDDYWTNKINESWTLSLPMLGVEQRAER